MASTLCEQLKRLDLVCKRMRQGSGPFYKLLWCMVNAILLFLWACCGRVARYLASPVTSSFEQHANFFAKFKTLSGNMASTLCEQFKKGWTWSANGCVMEVALFSKLLWCIVNAILLFPGVPPRCYPPVNCGGRTLNSSSG